MKDSEGFIVGCFVVLLLMLIVAALIYLLMNILLPFIGITHLLTWAQCFVAAIALTVIGLFVKGIFGRSS